MKLCVAVSMVHGGRLACVVCWKVEITILIMSQPVKKYTNHNGTLSIAQIPQIPTHPHSLSLSLSPFHSIQNQAAHLFFMWTKMWGSFVQNVDTTAKSCSTPLSSSLPPHLNSTFSGKIFEFQTAHYLLLLCCHGRRKKNKRILIACLSPLQNRSFGNIDAKQSIFNVKILNIKPNWFHIIMTVT